ncbi:kinase-like domain-containing protein [Boletus edulis]|nr:kinase-like domain-containing protein [Boletus edulis]
MVDIARLFKDNHELLAGFRMFLPEQSQVYFHELEDRTEISFDASTQAATVPQKRNLNEHEQEGELVPKTAPTQHHAASIVNDTSNSVERVPSPRFSALGQVQLQQVQQQQFATPTILDPNLDEMHLFNQVKLAINNRDTFNEFMHLVSLLAQRLLDTENTTTTSLDEVPNHTTERHFLHDLTNLVTRNGRDPVTSGGFADIYRGILQDDGESIAVAIKAIKTYSGEDGDFAKKLRRLRREIMVWLDLRHVNVVLLLGTTIGYGRFPAMVCPWAENGALMSYLEGHYGSLSVIEIFGLLSNVASGLHYLHSQSVVHGDLSGSNILIRENGIACIADFGLSTLLTELGSPTFATSFRARGTLRWTAPELLDLEVPENGMEEESPLAPTTQSDVYSFGGIVLQILSGKVPYHYYTREAQVVHAVSRGMTPRRPSCALVTERRWVFIQRCWSTVEIVQSCPSSEEIVVFTEEELAGAGTL